MGSAVAPVIRPATDDDAAGLIGLIGACWAEYPGCVLDVDGEVPELRAIATHFRQMGGMFWVAAQAGQIRGCIGLGPAPPDGIELHKLYVEQSARGRGLGERLASLVEAEARRRRAAFIALWSDTRFAIAHRFYERRGYVRQTKTRDLHDRSNTTEYQFIKRLTLD